MPPTYVFSMKILALILACLCCWLSGSWLYNSQPPNTAEDPAEPKL